MKKPSCLGCKERYSGCHSHCENYIQWKKEHEAEKAIINEARLKAGREIDDQKYRISKMRGTKRNTHSY